VPDTVTATARQHEATGTGPDQPTDRGTGPGQPEHGTQPLDGPGHGGHDAPVTVVTATADMRTLGDDTPVGIGLKPSGDQVLDMDNETDSPLARMRHQLYKDMGDVTDVLKENSQTVVSLIGERPPSSSHAGISSGHAEITRPPEHGLDGGQIAVAGLLAGMLAYEGTRRIKTLAQGRKGQRS